ncbi:MAG: MarR family winged helix-turn-helix transcriptional regulator [Christensenellales bacterium]
MENRYKAFTNLINQINRNIYKVKLSNMEEMGLKSTHTSCLYYLYIEEYLTLTELVKRCDENKPAISRTIEYLIKQGYVEKLNDSNNKYKIPLRLTLKGKEIGKTISKKG